MLTEILLTFLIVLIVLYFFNQHRRPSNFPPGPPWLPIVGNLPIVKKLTRTFGSQHLAFIELAKNYSSEVIGLKLGKEYVVVCLYSTVKKILTAEEFEGRPDNFFFKLRSMGTRKGITGTDGELWKEQRSFLVTHLRALGLGKNTVEEMVKEEIREILVETEKNLNNVDLGDILAPSVLNILWQLTSGKNIRNNQHIKYLLHLLRKRARAFDISGGILNLYPWLRFIAPNKTGFTLLQEINLEISNFIKEAIDDHKRNSSNGYSDDVIRIFMNEMKKRKGTNSNFTEDQLVMICLDIFLAGSTTTTNTMNFAFLAMILYPDIQEKVYQCLSKTFGQSEDISYNDRQRVPYVEAVLLECQRVFPVVPIIGPRRVLRTTTLNDYVIPKESTVLINIHSVHYDKEYWKDPENFRPERFLDNYGNLTGQERVMTFGLGKRRCLGDALAKTCIFLVFSNILRKYRLEAADDGEQLKPKATPGITMTPPKYKAKFIHRS